MRKAQTLVACLGALLTMPVLATGVAEANIVGPSSPTITLATDGYDWPFMARQIGMPVDEAISRFAWQDAFGTQVEALRKAYPTTFASAVIATTGPVGATVSFKGSVPRDASSFFLTLPAKVTFSAASPFSEVEYQQLIPAAHYAARDAIRSTLGEKAPEVVTELDSTGDTVLIHVLGEVDASVLQKAAEEVDDSLSSLTQVPIATVITADPDMSASSDTVRGGGYAAGCNTAFTVSEHRTHVLGVITADHCGPSLTYEGRNVLNYQRSIAGSRGDIEFFYVNGEAVAPQFYFDTNQWHIVAGHRQPVIGELLCKFGDTTKRTCDNVYDFFTCRGPYCNLVRTANRTTANGDSGGPWYDNAVAIGVHSGSVCTPICRSQFSYTANNIGPYLNLNIYGT